MPLPQQKLRVTRSYKVALQMCLSKVYIVEMRLHCLLSFFFETLSDWADNRFTSSLRPSLEDDSDESGTSIPSMCCFLACWLDGKSFRSSPSPREGLLPLLDFGLVPVKELLIKEEFFLLFNDSLWFKTQSNGVGDESVGFWVCLLEGCPDFFTSDLEVVDDGVSNFWNKTRTSSY